MVLWFLIVCTHVHYGTQCLAAQPMKSEKVCTFMAQSYRRTAEDVYTRCVGIPK